ncbi:MAG TPA: hypothetical protein VFO63_03495, partial [Blastocatellia bacterium]|nr:hypothetical protein [Blastocatellia bacterium]
SVRVIPEVIFYEDIDPDSFLCHHTDYTMPALRESKRIQGQTGMLQCEPFLECADPAALLS